MNDRYLYRAKRTDNEEWVEGNLVWSDDADDDYKAIIIPTTDINMFTRGGARGDLGFENWCRVDPSTICQCTGLKDKHGNLIFENDIVRCGKNCTVTWCDTFASWRLNTSGWMYSHFFGEACKAEDGQIVGNICDNPELLEVGE